MNGQYGIAVDPMTDSTDSDLDSTDSDLDTTDDSDEQVGKRKNKSKHFSGNISPFENHKK